MDTRTIEEENKLKLFVEKNNIKAEHLVYKESIHTVADCLRVTGIDIEDIAKTIVLIGPSDETIIACVPGKSRASMKRVGKLLNITPPVIASAQQALEKTGYSVGGTPFIGYSAIRIVDNKILEKEYVYSGGGSDRSLLKLWTSEMQKFDPIIGRIRK